jgi:hypothetical protein
MTMLFMIKMMLLVIMMVIMTNEMMLCELHDTVCPIIKESEKYHEKIDFNYKFTHSLNSVYSTVKSTKKKHRHFLVVNCKDLISLINKSLN